MNKRAISIIIVITTFSLMGIIATQMFWMYKSFRMREEQFNNKVKVSLKGVINQLMEYNRDTTKIATPTCQSFCCLASGNITTIVKPQLLDSLLKHEFYSIGISASYEYAVYNCAKDSIYFGNAKDYNKEILSSTHSIQLSCLWKKECFELGVFFPTQTEYVLGQMKIWFILSFLFMIVLILSFSYTIFFILKQKKLSEMKNDFINNMTHEFKTPISTISVTSELLMNPKVAEAADKVSKYAEVIFAENNRLKNQVERVLQVATLDKGEDKLSFKNADVHEIINTISKNQHIQILERNGKLDLELDAEKFIISADEHHLLNIFSNLLDNAVKYSKERVEINISTQSNDAGISIKFRDKGIGIKTEDQKYIFKKFYRVHTGDIHDVKGFGLGLYYVKTLVESHKGNISLLSELGKGSTFTVFLPYTQNI